MNKNDDSKVKIRLKMHSVKITYTYRKTSIKRLAPIKRRSQIDARGFGGRVSINAGLC